MRELLTLPRALLLGAALIASAIWLRPHGRYAISGGILLDTQTGRVWACLTMKDGEVACRLSDAARSGLGEP